MPYDEGRQNTHTLLFPDMQLSNVGLICRSVFVDGINRLVHLVACSAHATIHAGLHVFVQ